MRLITLLSCVAALLIGAVGLTSIAQAMSSDPVATASAKKRKAPKPTSRCPLHGATFKWGEVTSAYFKMRRKITYVRGGTKVRVWWRPKSRKYVACRVWMTGDGGHVISPRQVRHVRANGDSIEWTTPNGSDFPKVEEIVVYARTA